MPSGASNRPSVKRSLRRAFDAVGPGTRTGLSYAAAAVIIWFAARGIGLTVLLRSLRRADAGLFVLVCALSLLIWLLGETLLFSRLFSYFHPRTTFSEMLVPNTAQYFLQIVNVAIASGVLILFLNRRKGVPWLTGGATLLFQALVDFQVMALMTLAGLIMVGTLPVAGAGYYVGGLVVALSLLSWFWLRGRPRWRVGRLVYDRPSMAAFRRAEVSHYVGLFMIRAPIFACQGFVLYFEMLCFHIHVPLATVLADTPVILLITSLPLTPVGLGSEQLMMVLCFSQFAPKPDLLALSLATSLTGVFLRLLLGVAVVRAFAVSMDLAAFRRTVPALPARALLEQQR